MLKPRKIGSKKRFNNTDLYLRLLRGSLMCLWYHAWKVRFSTEDIKKVKKEKKRKKVSLFLFQVWKACSLIYTNIVTAG